ncbi:MAG: phosphatidate cytidylyltransferase [Planctomycetaceae bacterium]
MTTRERLFDVTKAFDHPVTVGVCIAIVAGLLFASVMIRVLHHRRSVDETTFRELITRTRSWYVLATLLVVPILLGAAWVIGTLCFLSLLCYREYARATGLFRWPMMSSAVVVTILMVYFAVIDHWPGFFTAAWPLAVCLISLTALLADQPKGFIQRVGLSVFGFALLGASLGHLAYLANDALFRPMLLWLLLTVELNDVFAYIAGKKFGRQKLAPNTSPNKTIGGAVGALMLTTILVSVIGHFVFQKTTLDHPAHLLVLGMTISVMGQCGDLVLSSIKRDLGIKDMAATIPGHGGFLDRFDSLLLVAPAVFHYVNYFKAGGVGLDQATRIISGV